jgi:hypothetical protein
MLFRLVLHVMSFSPFSWSLAFSRYAFPSLFFLLGFCAQASPLRSAHDVPSELLELIDVLLVNEAEAPALLGKGVYDKEHAC